MMEASDLKKLEPVGTRTSGVQLLCVVCADETSQVVVIDSHEVPVCSVHCNADAIRELELRFGAKVDE